LNKCAGHGLRVTHAKDVAEFCVTVRALHITDAQMLAKQKPVGDEAAMRTCDEQGSKDGNRASAEQRPSMGQDMQKGRRTEIEFLNGFVVREGEKVGLPCRANAVLTDLVWRIERDELKPDPRAYHGAVVELIKQAHHSANGNFAVACRRFNLVAIRRINQAAESAAAEIY
jgi:hypothetical protein